jgi:hypothetical protein
LFLIARQTDFQARLCVFIDGLDECKCDDHHGPQIKFLIEWIEAASNRNFKIKICIASRELNAIYDRLWQYPGCKIQDWTILTISDYVSSKLREQASLNPKSFMSESIETELISGVTDKAQGVFLWVTLVVDQLVTQMAEGTTEEKLTALPRDRTKV